MATAQNPQGHVRTTDYHGQPLLILFLLEDPNDVNAILADLNNHVSVLEQFATAWNTGVKDVNGVSPIPDASPCNVLMVIKQHHTSSYTPTEPIHITCKPASAALWNSNPPTTRGVVHVYSRNNVTREGFRAYRILHNRKIKYGSSTWQQAIRNAMNRQYRQTSAASASTSKTQASSNKTQTSSSKTLPNSSTTPGATTTSGLRPAGFFKNGAPYFYSQSQRMYYYFGPDGRSYRLK